jgi:coenzyme F420-reducing hydrogenase gamma subunit
MLEKLIIAHYYGATASLSVSQITGAGVTAHQSRILRGNTKLALLFNWFTTGCFISRALNKTGQNDNKHCLLFCIGCGSFCYASCYTLASTCQSSRKDQLLAVMSALRLRAILT